VRRLSELFCAVLCPAVVCCYKHAGTGEVGLFALVFDTSLGLLNLFERFIITRASLFV